MVQGGRPPPPHQCRCCNPGLHSHWGQGGETGRCPGCFPKGFVSAPAVPLRPCPVHLFCSTWLWLSPSLCQTECSSFPKAPKPSPVCDLCRGHPISLDPSLLPHLLSSSPASSSSSSKYQPGHPLLFGVSLALQAPPTVWVEYFVSRFHYIRCCFSIPEQAQGCARTWVPSKQGLALPWEGVCERSTEKCPPPRHHPLQPLLGALSGPTPSRSWVNFTLLGSILECFLFPPGASW